MFHFDVVETLAHDWLHACLFRRHTVLILDELTACTLAKIYPCRFLFRLFYTGDATTLCRANLTLLLLSLMLSVLLQLLLVLVKNTRG